MSATPRLTGDRCKCTACGLIFKSAHSFDAHRVGKGNGRRCLTPPELAARGYLPNNLGFIRKEREHAPVPSP